MNSYDDSNFHAYTIHTYYNYLCLTLPAPSLSYNMQFEHSFPHILLTTHLNLTLGSLSYTEDLTMYTKK